MMKKIYFILIAGLLLANVSAQIGVQNEKPLGIFHIDPLRDTNANGTSGTSDDVIVTTTGQVGIGTVAPSTKLDVRGTFRLRNGEQANNKVLVSDASGNAHWQDRPRLDVIEVNNVNTILASRTFTTTPSYSGVSITLPAGGWQLMFQVTCTSSNNMFWDLCLSATSYSLTDPANRRAMSSGLNPASVTAIYFVNNSTTTTYYLWASTRSGNAAYLGSGVLWALPIS